MSCCAIILAAGKGTRMKSDLPKILHEVCGRAMLDYVIKACREAGCEQVVIVIGHEAGAVRQQLAHLDHEVAWVEQTEQLGTGHAVMACAELLGGADGAVLVVAGDGPLIRPQTLRELVRTHRDNQAACTLATSIMDDPGRYGRILRGPDGRLEGIVEYLDADDQQREIREVNVSLYCFDGPQLLGALGKLSNDNAKGEYYITDLVGIFKSAGATVSAGPVVPADEVASVNTPEQLAHVNRIMAARLADGEQNHE